MISDIIRLSALYVLARVLAEIAFPSGKVVIKYLFYTGVILTVVGVVGPQINRMTSDLHEVAVTYTKAREGVQSIKSGVDAVTNLPEMMESIPYVGVAAKYPPGITLMEKLRPSTIRFSVPVVGPISQPFKGADHHGIDIAVNVGTPVKASRVGVICVNHDSIYGDYVIVDHGEGWQTLYAHLSKVSAKAGDKVLGGSIIGLSGGIKGAEGSGNSEGPHLHFEIRVGGIVRDPQPYLR